MYLNFTRALHDIRLIRIMQAGGIPEETQQRYIHWKKNTKLLYSYLNTNSTKWPSLTCQFMPDLETTQDQHRILLSSFTSSQLPEDESLYIAKLSTVGHLEWSSLNNFDMEEMEFKRDPSVKLPPKHLATEVQIRFPQGDCNRARYQPSNPDVIAAASSDGSIYIFNKTKHGTSMARSITAHKDYQARLCTGPEGQSNVVDNEAVSLSWNSHKEGVLGACYSNGQILIWDLKQRFSRADTTITTPETTINFDSNGCNDIHWMPMHDSLFAACGESNKLSLFDTRLSGDKEVTTIGHYKHEDGINSCKFNSHNSMLLASADTCGKLNLWDVRKLDKDPILALDHGSSVSTLEWNPHMDTIIASAGQDDGLVKLWDITTQEPVFVHGGHMLGVNDISWDFHDPWLMCSVSNDNSIQLWKPADNIVGTI